jgi:hypothetical protein
MKHIYIYCSTVLALKFLHSISSSSNSVYSCYWAKHTFMACSLEQWIALLFDDLCGGSKLFESYVFSLVVGTCIPLDFHLFQVNVWNSLLVKCLLNFMFLISLASFKSVSCVKKKQLNLHQK